MNKIEKNIVKNTDNNRQKKPLKLLIVEDDEINRMVMEKIAIRKGWEVLLAENGEVAVDIYQKLEFEVIIMDCQMPILDGFKATRAIRQLESNSGTHIPIIALTANTLEGDREKCLNAGMDDYLTKPIETNDFYTIVEKWSNKSCC
ncbi:CheY-like receiver domain-containing protein [Desulfosporosinus acidiphilus SJ4]|uniref:Stage 0 sporulation protein A homolog n=1 Tax=Desulfosporosinus acidiphilus (strain DSM 22704 / JCM 16185 / SJ4) TaxID=646529 RepID=I4D1N0_DESAJ|nr:response regulator [Desulfosporosinus acidiphilus]AFM39704.1 CheY-like receiver domain-containing protein [Desulfosporosinus acidiphilus SJ4]